jgi:hypothetical protein
MICVSVVKMEFCLMITSDPRFPEHLWVNVTMVSGYHRTGGVDLPDLLQGSWHLLLRQKVNLVE